MAKEDRKALIAAIGVSASTPRERTQPMSTMNPWKVRAADFPGEGSAIDKLRFALNYAVTAPSSHNTQPWLFRLHGDKLDVIADRTRALPVIDPHDRELTISCGAAIGMLRIALRAFGFEPNVELLPDRDDPGLLATIELGRTCEATPVDIKLRDAILHRRTTRTPFHETPLDNRVLGTMLRAAARDFVELRFFTGNEERARLAALIGEADKLQFADPSFRRELAGWMHARHGLAGDGMSVSSMGVPDVLTPISALAIRTFDVGRGRAALSTDIVKFTPALAVLVTDRDCVEDWLLAGQALAHLLVIATAEGLSSGYLNQPVEVPGLRLGLAQMVSPHSFPQLVLRIGRGPSVPPASRRGIDEVIVGESELARL